MRSRRRRRTGVEKWSWRKRSVREEEERKEGLVEEKEELGEGEDVDEGDCGGRRRE